MKTYCKTGLVSPSVAAFSLFNRATAIKGRRVKGQISIRNTGAIAVFLGLVVGTARLASAQYDPVAQFSLVNNPNGVWSYGWESVPLGSPFNLFPGAAVPFPATPGPFIGAWEEPTFGELGIYYNQTAASQLVTVGSQISQFDPGMLAMNTGPNDEYPMVLFTAPANGIYTIGGTFEGIDTVGTESSVYLLENNLVITTGNVLGFGPGSDVTLASGPIPLIAGQTLAYAVGGLPLNSMTALVNAQISAVAVPEPSAYALLGLALVLLAVRGRFVRNRKAAVV
ncbi:MAG: PEP-CTERM sorting domain-containing protein [Verrucomicrobiia bacterium]